MDLNLFFSTFNLLSEISHLYQSKMTPHLPLPGVPQALRGADYQGIIRVWEDTAIDV
jgi:hypothetical protein